MDCPLPLLTGLPFVELSVALAFWYDHFETY
jgi:hypothetical protein